MTAEEILSILKLEPHPEGGAFRETYRAAIGSQTAEPRSACTAIYFLLREQQRTEWHRVRYDEIYHYYGGGALELALISPGGKFVSQKLGMNLAAGERPQVIIPGGYWQSARTFDEWTLIGCTVSPGFDFRDFEISDSTQLKKQFPNLTLNEAP